MCVIGEEEDRDCDGLTDEEICNDDIGEILFSFTLIIALTSIPIIYTKHKQ